MLLAFKLGKHVVIEHPLVTTPNHAKLLLSFVYTTKLKTELRVVQISQVFPSFIRQHKEFKSGKIGNLELLEASFIGHVDLDPNDNNVNNHFRPLEGLSQAVTLMRCFVKNVDIVHAVAQVSAAAKARKISTPDIYVVNLTSTKGQIATLTVHCTQEHTGIEPIMKCTLYGTKGTSCATYPDMVYIEDLGDGPQKKDLLSADNMEYYFNKEKKMSTPYGCYANYLTHYAKSITATQNSCQINIMQGLQTDVLLEAIMRSVTSGKPQTVKDVKREIYGADNTDGDD